MNFTEPHHFQTNSLGQTPNHITNFHNSQAPLPSYGGDSLATVAQDNSVNTGLKGIDAVDNVIGGQQNNSTDTFLKGTYGSGNDMLVGDASHQTDNLTSSNSSPTPNAAPPPPTTTTTTNNGPTYYVSPNGSDDNPGTSDKPWKTINYAVSDKSAVKAGDTILVQPGTYNELIDLGKSGDSKSGNITLKANGDVTLRDPDPNNGGFGEGVIHSQGKGYWTIDGFRIENTSWAGIALQEANNMIVQNNHTYQTGASGIIIMPGNHFDGGEQDVVSKNIKILNNTIEQANWKWQNNSDSTHTQEALSIWGVDGFEVANNTLKQGNREGIDLKVGTRNGSLHDNSVTGEALVSGTANGYRGGPAIYLDGNAANMFNIDVYNNSVFNNTADGIVIGDEVPNQGDVSGIRVYNNVVYGNGQNGLNGGRGITVTSNVHDVQIVNNTVAKNVQSFYIDGADYTGGYRTHDIQVSNNIFSDNSYRNGYINSSDNVTLDHNLYGDQYSLYEGGGNNNLNADNTNIKTSAAGFANLNGNDFHLTSGSPAIDTGSSNIGQYAKQDKDGKQRPAGAGVDIGAYEK